jgi:hypothetical protein
MEGHFSKPEENITLSEHSFSRELNNNNNNRNSLFFDDGCNSSPEVMLLTEASIL